MVISRVYLNLLKKRYFKIIFKVLYIEGFKYIIVPPRLILLLKYRRYVVTWDKDKNLVTNILNGDSESFSLLVQLYQNRLYNFFLKLTLSKEDAEELLQDVFLRVYKYLYKYNDRWDFSTWIYKIAVNTYKSSYKKKKNDPGNISFDEVSHLCCETYNPENSYEAKEKYKETLKMFDCLKDEQKLAFLLKHIQGFTYKEIGSIMGISEHAAKMKVQRGKQILCDRYYKLSLRGVQ